MLLPVDANNEPIHVGDVVAEKPFRPNIGEKPAEVVCMLLNSDGWAIGDCDPRGHWYGPLQLEHVKPDPLKELLSELANEVWEASCTCQTTWSDSGLDGIEERYAERIRELLKEGGE